MSFKDSLNKTKEFTQDNNFINLGSMLDNKFETYEQLVKVVDEYNRIKDILGPKAYVFRKEDGEKFWAKYNDIKSQLYPEYEARILQTVDESINQSVEEALSELDNQNSVEDIKAYKKTVYRVFNKLMPAKDEITNRQRSVVTRKLYNAADDKMSKLQQAA